MITSRPPLSDMDKQYAGALTANRRTGAAQAGALPPRPTAATLRQKLTAIPMFLFPVRSPGNRHPPFPNLARTVRQAPTSYQSMVWRVTRHVPTKSADSMPVCVRTSPEDAHPSTYQFLRHDLHRGTACEACWRMVLIIKRTAPAGPSFSYPFQEPPDDGLQVDLGPLQVTTVVHVHGL